MIYENPRPFSTCKIWSRERDLKSQYSDYKCVGDFQQGGEVEIRVKIPNDGKEWDMTRRVRITAYQTPHIGEEKGEEQCLSLAFHNYLIPKNIID